MLLRPINFKRKNMNDPPTAEFENEKEALVPCLLSFGVQDYFGDSYGHMNLRSGPDSL